MREGALPSERRLTVRALLLVGFAALGVHVTSLGNGFALDDEGVLVRNPVISAGDVGGALRSPWWRREDGGGLLYRPLTQASFALEWRAFGGRPAPFHAVNLVAHAGASLLLTLLLFGWVPAAGAAAGGLLFAVHPVHVEAVANVVGRAELYAAVAYLAACLLYLWGAAWGAGLRAVRLVGIAVLYGAALAAKEGAVTLPLALVLLEGWRPRVEPGAARLGTRLAREAPLHALLAATLLAYLGARFLVLGELRGEVAHPAFHGLGPAAPFLTGLSLWPHYVRLMVYPHGLSASYDPAVLDVHDAVGPHVVLGACVLAGLLILALRLRRNAPLVSLGILWFFVTVLPVSHLLVSPAVLLAERTLYLPSAGVAMAVAALAARFVPAPRRVRAVAACAGVLTFALLSARTAERVPSWLSSYTVYERLFADRPESALAQLGLADGLLRAGRNEEAAHALSAALVLMPGRYGTLLQAAAVDGSLGRWESAELHLATAVELRPGAPEAYLRLAEVQLLGGRAGEAHATLARALARTSWDARIWELLAEAHRQRGEEGAALRALAAAGGQGARALP